MSMCARAAAWVWCLHLRLSGTEVGRYIEAQVSCTFTTHLVSMVTPSHALNG